MQKVMPKELQQSTEITSRIWNPTLVFQFYSRALAAVWTPSFSNGCNLNIGAKFKWKNLYTMSIRSDGFDGYEEKKNSKILNSMQAVTRSDCILNCLLNSNHMLCALL